MQLTTYSDYSLRLLLYLAAAADHSGTIGEIAAQYGISRNHLVKVAHNLGKLGYIETRRGRQGGLRLARPAPEINLGEVVRAVEPNFHLVECFDAAQNRCVITPVCVLRGVLQEGLDAFFGVLARYSLADLAMNRDELLSHFERSA